MDVPLPRTTRPWLADCWPPLVVVAAGYLVVAFFLPRAFDFNSTGPIRIGDFVPGDRFWTPTTCVERGGVGYDGQWFFYLAHDPLLGAPDSDVFFDLPAYRAARILYPALAWAAALGQPAAIPWSLLGVNLLAVLVGTAATLDILRQLGGNRWLALACALSPPFLIGVLATLAEPTSLALVAWGIALALRRRHVAAGIVLAFAVLAREPSILVPMGLGLYAAARHDWRRTASYLAPLILPFGWNAYIWARLGSLPSAQSPTNFGMPFGGAYYRLGLLLGWHPPMLGEPVPSGNVTAEVAIILTSITIIVVGLTKIQQRRDAFAWLLWMQALQAALTGSLVWADLYSYGRVLGLLYLCYGLVLLTAPHRLRRLGRIVAEWTTGVPALTILHHKLKEPITLAPGTPLSTLKRHEHPN
jgi:hypothetical protein